VLSRRFFLNGALSAGAAWAAAQASSVGAQTAQPQRKRMIVDSQVHIWPADTPEHPWMFGREAAAAGAVHDR
jgi:hypothetical protein